MIQYTRDENDRYNNDSTFSESAKRVNALWHVRVCNSATCPLTRFPCAATPRLGMSLPSITTRTSRKKEQRQAAAQRTAAALAAKAAGTVPRAAPTVDASRFELIDVKTAPKVKRKPGEVKLPAPLRDGAVLFQPGGKAYKQAANIPPSASGLGALQTFLSGKGKRKLVEGLFHDDDVEYFGDNDGEFRLAFQPVSRHRRRRLQQHQNWLTALTDSIVALYLATKYAVEPRTVRESDCLCRKRELDVVLATWDCMSLNHGSRAALTHVQHQRMSYFKSASATPLWNNC